MLLRRVMIVAVILLAVGLAQPALSDAATTLSEEEVEERNRQFAGLNFGVGLSATVDTGNRDRISDATVDANGIVRVNKKEGVRARVMLESHYFFSANKKEVITSDRTTVEATSLGIGPFIAVQPGSDEIIEAIGMGVMFGFKRMNSTTGDSFNVGVGFIVDTSVQVLGDEFIENQPAPLDPAGDPLPIRLQETDQGGILVLVSFSW